MNFKKDPESNMNPNLTCKPSYKDIYLRKLSYAITCSVVSQLILLQIYVFLHNFNVLHPQEWLLSVVSTWRSLGTILAMIQFSALHFALAILYSKDYVVKSTHCSTRFEKFISVFSIHNLVMLIFHVTIGAALVWVFLSLGKGPYKNLVEEYKGQRYCLNSGTFYLVLSGAWAGFYYFLKVYLSKKALSFPVIHQRKFLQLKSQLRGLVKESVTLGYLPTVYYIILYYIQGDTFERIFSTLFGLVIKQGKTDFLFINAYVFFFTSLYCFCMTLLRFFFNLFLTEPVQFPLITTNNTLGLTLQENIVNSDWPIVQNLACLDLYCLAQWYAPRRQIFFSLSQPGGHPHNWNLLVENILKLLKEYNDLLSRSTDASLTDKVTLESKPVVAQPASMPAFIKSPERYRNLRNMSIKEPWECSLVNVTHVPLIETDVAETLVNKLEQKLNKTWNFIKIVLGINFLFGELPQANIQKCLADGQLVIWASQGISDIVCASLTEDRFGIVQKDIPVIVTTLVSLKQNLDKLNKLTAFSRKIVGYDESNYRMKGAVTAAVKRSLFNICRTFGEYLNELPLSKDVMTYLQVHVVCKC